MMLTPEQLEYELSHVVINTTVLRAHIDAQQARIAELEAKAGAGNEWRRAHDDLLASLNKANGRIAELDGLLQSASNHCNATANERNELRGQYASLLSLLADIRIACGDNGKRMQDELVAYISELEQDAERWREHVDRWRKIYATAGKCIADD